MLPVQNEWQDGSRVDWEADGRRISAVEPFGDEGVADAGWSAPHRGRRETADEIRAELGNFSSIGNAEESG
jgi:hypothetical protein